MKTNLILVSMLVVLSVIVQAAPFKSFKCKSLDLKEDTVATLSFNKKAINVKTTPDTPSFNSFAFTGKLDATYKPKVEGSVRYLVANSGGDNTRIIIDANMFNGRAGKMRLEGNTDSYWSSYFSCK